MKASMPGKPLALLPTTRQKATRGGGVSAPRIDYSRLHRVVWTARAGGGHRTLSAHDDLGGALEAFVCWCEAAAAFGLAGTLDILAPGGKSLRDVAIDVELGASDTVVFVAREG